MNYPVKESPELLLELFNQISLLKSGGLKRNEIIQKLSIHELTYTRVLSFNRQEKINKSKPFARLELLVNNFKNKNGNYPQKDYSYLDVINKFGNEPVCFYTGKSINWFNSGYSLDHIIPVSKGGLNELFNMELVTTEVNRLKYDLDKDYFISLCKDIARKHE